MKLNLAINFSSGRGAGVDRSPYFGLPRFNSHYGYNFGLSRMQGSYDLYCFGLHLWLIW